MLSVLRHKGVSKKILWVIAVVIILSFGVFGTAWRLENSVNIAGKMYGHGVPMRAFQKAYLDSRDQAIMLYGDQFYKIANRLNLEEEAWNRLLLLQEASKRGIKTSDQEVVAFIASLPFFNSHGQFDRSLYQNIVENPQGFDRKVHDFEEGIRSQLTIKKLLDQVVGNPSINDDELKKEYIFRHEKIKVTYALFESPKNGQGLTGKDKNFGKADAAFKSIQEGLKQNETFKELAQAAGARVDETPPFSRGEYIANGGLVAEFQEAALSIDKQNPLSPLLTTSQGPAIIYLESTEPIDEHEYQNDKDNFKNMMLAQRKTESIQSFLIQLKFAAHIQSNINRNK